MVVFEVGTSNVKQVSVVYAKFQVVPRANHETPASAECRLTETVCTYFGCPVSTTESIICPLIGVGIAADLELQVKRSLEENSYCLPDYHIMGHCSSDRCGLLSAPSSSPLYLRSLDSWPPHHARPRNRLGTASPKHSHSLNSHLRHGTWRCCHPC